MDKMLWIIYDRTIESIKELDVCNKSQALAEQVKVMSDHWAEEIAHAYSYAPVRAVGDYIGFLYDWREDVVKDVVSRFEQIKQSIYDDKDLDRPDSIVGSREVYFIPDRNGEHYTLSLTKDSAWIEIAYKGMKYTMNLQGEADVYVDVRHIRA